MKIKLSKILKSLESGGRPKGGATLNDNGIPSIGAEHLDSNGGFNFKSVKYIPVEYFDNLKNGIIETENILIVKDGATTGKVSFVDKDFPFMKSAVNEHVFLLKINKSKAFPKYIFQYLRTQQGQRNILRDFRGATVGGISRGFVEFVSFPLPTIPDQVLIANLLTNTETIITLRKQSIILLDEFLRSTFLEMFGDALTNKLKWDKVELKKFGKIITGNTPPRNNDDNYSSDFIEWIKTDNINSDKTYITKAIEYLSESGLKNARTVEKGALLIACIAGSIESVGRAALANRTVSFNQQINAIQPNKDIEPLFLYWLFKISKKYVQNHATKGMKKILTKGVFEKITMIKPPLVLQSQFAQIVEKTEVLKAYYQSSLQELENLYGSLSLRAFRGELELHQNAKDLSTDIDETDKTDLISEKILPVENDEKKKDDNMVSKEPTKNLIPDFQPLPTHREKIKQSYKIINTIKTHYRNRYFTFEEFSEKLIESGHDYKFETVRNEIFNLLRDNKLRQVFADAAFKSSFDKSHPDYNEVQELEERIYLTLKSERK